MSSGMRSISHGRGSIEVEKSRYPATLETEQQLLGLADAVDLVSPASSEAVDLVGGEKGRGFDESRRLGVDRADPGKQRIFGDALGDQGEIDQLLHGRRHQHECTAVGQGVEGAVIPVERDRMLPRALEHHVHDEGQMLAGDALQCIGKSAGLPAFEDRRRADSR